MNKPVVTCKYDESPSEIFKRPVRIEVALSFEVNSEKEALEALKRAYDDVRSQVESVMTLG